MIAQAHKLGKLIDCLGEIVEVGAADKGGLQPFHGELIVVECCSALRHNHCGHGARRAPVQVGCVSSSEIELTEPHERGSQHVFAVGVTGGQWLWQ
ncbi:unannotated protein [freshwater metagenome]|uniref:Unannotated protein n=1 Tax=freshwater metagenome TaxID=449393 RepID=A0A6J6YLH9_9ZZZZ